MMEALVDVLSWACLAAGGFFCAVGGLGLLRMPDFYARCHAAGVTDTMGVPLILLGCALQSGWSETTIKLGFILFFVYVSSSTATHALVKTAYTRGPKPVLDRPERIGSDAGGGSGVAPSKG